mmetsp:Transcript_91529/g.261550  ORF Transcript_91529/g.261550 Transcript_91529/m.261550 type:complete len:201 (-) Transcript_91529:453-1055(-)
MRSASSRSSRSLRSASAAASAASLVVVATAFASSSIDRRCDASDSCARMAFRSDASAAESLSSSPRMRAASDSALIRRSRCSLRSSSDMPCDCSSRLRRSASLRSSSRMAAHSASASRARLLSASSSCSSCRKRIARSRSATSRSRLCSFFSRRATAAWLCPSHVRRWPSNAATAVGGKDSPHPSHVSACARKISSAARL